MTEGWLGSPEQLGRVLREAGEGITVQGPDGELLFANRAAAALMGFATTEELLKTPIADVMGRFELLDADGRPFPLSDLPGRRALLGEPAPRELVRFREDATGQDRWSLVRATAVTNDGGAVQFVINAFQDVTDLKRSEARLRLMADAGAVLGESVDYEESLARLAHLVVREVADWCVVDIEERPGQVARIAVAHRDPDKLRLAEGLQQRWPTHPGQSGAAQEVLRTGQPALLPSISPEVLRAASRDDEHFRLLSELGLHSGAILPLVARGKVLGTMTLIRAETPDPFSADELPWLEELGRRAGVAIDTAQLLHDSMEAVRMRDDFLAMASHDMRTPLAAILGYVELTQRRLVPGKPVPGKVLEYLVAAERVSLRLTTLVGELLDNSLLRSGRPLALEETQIDLGVLAQTYVDTFRRIEEGREIRVEAEPAVVVAADRQRLERVLDNLLSNAVKYSPDGGRIVVGVDGGETGARLWVTDTGIGIPAADLPRLFERYRRASNVGALRGTGLGLAGAREVMRQMGGDITVDSEEGKGSTFTIRLPRSASSPPG